ncbi:MAG: OmpA family protein [Magnetospirillum sp.]|nr:OmpA family protein [Magnetospirillum sp.]
MTSRITALAARALPSALAAALLAACAGQMAENPRVSDMRRQVDVARNNPNITRYAPNQLQEAQQSLTDAEAAARAGDEPQLDHDLYMTRQRLAIASYQTEAHMAREQARIAVGPGAMITNVPFETGKATFRAGAANRLQSVAAYLKTHPGVRATVEGFTDTTGHPEVNQQLSFFRALAVKNYLVGQGVPPSRVLARGMGEEYPLATNASPSGRQDNRRAEVMLSQLPPQLTE